MIWDNDKDGWMKCVIFNILKHDDNFIGMIICIVLLIYDMYSGDRTYHVLPVWRF